MPSARYEWHRPELPAVHLGGQRLSAPAAWRGADPAENQAALAKALRFAQGMRSHGVANFPDPTTAGVVHLLGVDTSSRRFQSADKVCAALVPGAASK